MNEKELEKYLEIVNHFISDDGNLEEIKTYIANVLYDVDEHYKNYKQEIERLNNIINELEEELDRGYRDLFEHELVPGRELITNIKNYLQELKGDGSNE